MKKKNELFELLCTVGQYCNSELNEEVDENLFWIDDIDDLTEKQAEDVVDQVKEIMASYYIIIK